MGSAFLKDTLDSPVIRRFGVRARATMVVGLLFLARPGDSGVTGDDGGDRRTTDQPRSASDVTALRGAFDRAATVSA